MIDFISCKLISALTSSLFVCFSAYVCADLTIIHFNVGMGDSTLLWDTGSDKTMLIDAGNRGKGNSVLVPEFKTLGLNEINYFVATHYDADHIGGFDEVVKSGIVFTEGIYDRGNYTHRELYGKVRLTQYGEYVAEAFKSGLRQNIGDVLTKCEPINLGVTKIWVVASSGEYISSFEPCVHKKEDLSKHDDNGLSIALVVEHVDFRYFIGGDLTGGGKRTNDMETRVATAVGDVDVLKLNHHGSSSSSNQRFLYTTQPNTVVVSVGNGGVNKSIYHLPNHDVFERITSLSQSPPIYLTNEGEGARSDNATIADGHIVIHTNGHYYSVNGDLYRVDERVHVEE